MFEKEPKKAINVTNQNNQDDDVNEKKLLQLNQMSSYAEQFVKCRQTYIMDY